MYQNYRIAVCTPAGRRAFLETQLPYIFANRHLIDEWHLWFNPRNAADAEYVEALAEEHRGFVTLDKCGRPTGNISSIPQFYNLTRRHDTIYIRTDDDIVFLDNTCIHKLLQSRLRHRHALVVFANIINNALCTHILQRINAVPTTFGISGWTCMDATGWANPQFAYSLHRHFLDNINHLESFRFPDFHLFDYPRFSINCFAWFGRDFDMYFESTNDEEQYISADRPRQLHRPNVICGNAIVSHFAFYTQAGFLLSTDLLERYRRLALTFYRQLDLNRRA